MSYNAFYYLIICHTEREAHYLFKQTIRLLSERVSRVNKVSKEVSISVYTLRFVTDYEYGRKCLRTLRAKEVDGRSFESILEEIEIVKKVEGGGQ